MPAQGNTRLSYLAERDCEERAERRRRVSGWKSRLRWRKPLEAHLARPLWEEFLRGHDGDKVAAMGEVIAALIELGALREEEPRW